MKVEEIFENVDMQKILSDPFLACDYAINVLKGPFPEGENIIAESGRFSCTYALMCTHKRFKLGEPAIAKYDDMMIWSG